MRSVISLILVYCLAITSVFAQSVNPNDTLKIGKASSSSDKGLTFDTNDGVSNKKLLIEKISKKLKFDGNTFQIGDGSSSSDKELIIAGALKSLKYNGTSGEFEFNDDVKLSGTLKADFLQAVNTEVAINSLLRASQGIKVGAGANEIRVNAGNLEFSNDGVLYKKFGTGTGGGSTGVNLLANDSFEDGISTGWTSSGGTFSQQTYANGVEGDLKYGRLVASTSGQYVETTAVAIPDSFSGGCQADFKKVNVATAGLFKIQAMDTTAAIVYAEQTIGVSSWIKVPTISFPCPVAGTMVKLRLISLAAGTIDFDKGYFGSNQNIITVGKYDVGEILTSAGSCPSGSLPADGTAVSRSTYSILFGRIGITHGQGDGTTTFNLPDYRGRFLRGVDGGINRDVDKASRTAMNTGGNTGDNVGSVQTDALKSHTHTVPGQNGGAALNTAYANQNNNNSNTNNNIITAATGGSETRPINAYVNYCIRFQSNSDDSAISNEQSSWFIDANIGGANANLGVAAVTSYSEITSPSLDLVINNTKGSANAEIACASGTASTSTTCSSNESIGIAFAPPYAGSFEACFDFGYSMNLNATSKILATFQIVETLNNSSSILQEGLSRVTSGIAASGTSNPHMAFPNKLCGNFNFPDVSKRTLRLMYEQSVSGTVASSEILGDRSSADGQRDIHVTIRPLLSAYNRPILTGDEVTTKGVKTTQASAFITVAPAVVNEIGDFLTTCSSGGADTTTCLFNPGFFLGTPNCTVGGSNIAASTEQSARITVTSSDFTLRMTSSGAANKFGVYVYCHGNRPL